MRASSPNVQLLGKGNRGQCVSTANVGTVLNATAVATRFAASTAIMIRPANCVTVQLRDRADADTASPQLATRANTSGVRESHSLPLLSPILLLMLTLCGTNDKPDC